MRITTLIITLFICISSSITCLANTMNVKDFSFENDIKMNGVISSAEKFFYVKDNWNVEEAKLNLVLTKSELLDVDYSTITILINDTPITSQLLDGNKEYKDMISIDIPKDLIKSGFNKVTIKAYKTISDLVCRDDSNTANWLVLHKESSVNIKYSYEENEGLLSEFNDIYIREDNGSRLTTSILIPEDFSSVELSGAMIFSASFGKENKYKNFDVGFSTYPNLENNEDNIIFVGKTDTSPIEILDLLDDNEKSLLNDNCIIKQVTSPFNSSSKMLIIISNNDELLINGCKLMTSNDLLKNLNYNTIAINEEDDVEDLIEIKSLDKVYLKDLGYDNLIVKGPFNQEINFDINIPKNKQVTEETKMKFNIRYSENLDFERSLMTVYLNEIPIGSKRLYLDKANDDIFEANIPKELLGKNYYTVKIAFDLNVRDLQCVTRDTDNPWAYVDNSSFVQFNYMDNNNISFENYPYPFILDDEFNNVKIIVPDSMNGSDLSNLSEVISYIGKDVKFNTGKVEVLKISEFNKEDNEGNLIIYGTPSTNSLIKDINNNLNVKFNEDFNGLQSNDKIKFIGDYPTQIATVQLLNSPFNSNFSAMVVTATDSDDLDLATEYLNDISITRGLTGDTIILDRYGNVEVLDYQAKEINIDNENENKNEDEVVEEKIKINDEGTIFIIVALVLFITIVIVILLIVKKYKIK